MVVQIDKGVPMPGLRHGNAKYPWDEMGVGDSFVVPRTSNGRSLAISASQSKGRLGKKQFESRKTGDIERIWRVK